MTSTTTFAERVGRARGALGIRWRWFRSPSFRSVPCRWSRLPEILPDAEVCLFVAVARAGRLLPHALFHAEAWAVQGFRVVLIVVVEDLAAPFDSAGLGWAEGVLLRENRGYDFGAWAAGIDGLPGLATASRLVIANDSVLGPLQGFTAMVDRAREAESDVLALTRSVRPAPHLQSFVLFFGPRALRNRGFGRFWSSMRTGNRTEVIHRCELRLAAVMTRAGLQCGVLFPQDPPDLVNPTLTAWERLLDEGFPYVKVQLLRDNPFAVPVSGWRRKLLLHGFDPAVADPLHLPD